MISRLREDLKANTQKKPTIILFAWALLSNPGFLTVFLFRVSQRAEQFGALGHCVAVLTGRINSVLSGCYLAVDSSVGPGCRMPHPTGIVLGNGVQLGRDITLYQGVTLGVSSAESDSYPSVGDNTIVYAGAVIVGGVRVGRNCRIGANSVVCGDVPDDCLAVGAPARIIARPQLD